MPSFGKLKIEPQKKEEVNGKFEEVLEKNSYQLIGEIPIDSGKYSDKCRYITDFDWMGLKPMYGSSSCFSHSSYNPVTLH